jgi:hypothetical protein
MVKLTIFCLSFPQVKANGTTWADKFNEEGHAIPVRNNKLGGVKYEHEEA